MTERPTNPPPRRRWLQFSLRTLLVFTAILSIILGWFGSLLVRTRQQRAVVAKVQSLGGRAYYDYQMSGAQHIQANPSPGTKFLRLVVGDDAFAQVEYVSFDYTTRIVDEDLAFVSQLPELKWVAVHGPGITDKGMEQVARISKLSGLSLSNTKVTAQGLACLGSARRLTELTLYGSAVTDTLLPSIRQLPSLGSLQLVKTNITSGGLAQLKELPQLRRLDILVGTGVDDEGVRHLADSTQLESLQLVATAVSDDGVWHVRKLHGLRSLNLGATRVTDAGLAHLRELAQLELLYLGGTQVTDAGLVHLKGFKQLQRLNLQDTKVTDAGLRHLHGLTQLRELYLVRTQVTDAGVAELQKALPNCKIER